mmetsp:Transcript_116659/g.329978  ORF Transcript_116659/g.329978 Transcript_116659/m.329978 type:complete len:200 (+) Transcript_116659:539-1138(+)
MDRVTGRNGTMPCTQCRPVFVCGFWSQCMPSVLGLAAAGLPGADHQGRQPIKVSKDVRRSSVCQISANARWTLRLPRTAHAAALWPPPRVQKKPLSSKPGKLSSVQVAASSRRAFPPKLSSHSQKRPFTWATSSGAKTARMRTTPSVYKCCSHPAVSSSTKSGMSIARGGWKAGLACVGATNSPGSPAIAGGGGRDSRF